MNAVALNSRACSEFCVRDHTPHQRRCIGPDPGRLRGPPPRPAFDPADELEDLFGQMKSALMERMLAGELTAHLGYGPREAKPEGQPNVCNGSTPKTVLTDDGAVDLAIPRDRSGTFAPQLVPKHARRLPRFDANVLSLYARGMSVREIREYLEALHPVEIARP